MKNIEKSFKNPLTNCERYDRISRQGKQRPVGQAAKTSASHAENMGSIPVPVTRIRHHRCGVFFLFWWPVRGISPGDECRGVRIPLCGIRRIAWEYRIISTSTFVCRKACRTLAGSRSIPVSLLSYIAKRRRLVSRQAHASVPIDWLPVKNMI